MVLLQNGVLYASDKEKHNICENKVLQDNNSEAVLLKQFYLKEKKKLPLMII